MLGYSNLLTPPILFFMLGMFAQFVRSDLAFPKNFSRILAMYLMIGIGVHGGLELRHAELDKAFLHY